ncbi:MAG TPA: Fis family transcriptional regulator [Methylococcaceae bacterium]|nr:Fis family transcriptional regulator [Methylococcaceae bacterium]
MSSQHKENPHIGSDFDDFLSEDAILEEVTSVAANRVIAWQISEGMTAHKLSKTAMAKKCTPAELRSRLPDEEDTSLTLTTLVSAATALGKKVKIELEPI